MTAGIAVLRQAGVFKDQRPPRWPSARRTIRRSPAGTARRGFPARCALQLLLPRLRPDRNQRCLLHLYWRSGKSLARAFSRALLASVYMQPCARVCVLQHRMAASYVSIEFRISEKVPQPIERCLKLLDDRPNAQRCCANFAEHSNGPNACRIKLAQLAFRPRS